jgi:hypothetical protein
MRSIKLLLLGLALATFALTSALADEPMPTFTGKGKVTDAINGKLGAVFDLGAGITMTFPRGLPVGESRLVTLQKGRALPGKLVHAKFRGVGPVLDFSGAFTTARSPIVLAVPSAKEPTARGMKLIIAMEIGTFCEGANKTHKLKNGLCSGFELHEAEYEAESKRVVAKLGSTGGMRMQFGLVPEDGAEKND